MQLLQLGQHFGHSKKKLHLDGTILTEASCTTGVEIPWHYHENAYFYMHLKGTHDEVNKKDRITCQPGTLLFHHWQDPHYNTNFSQESRFFHIEIEKSWFQRFHLNPNIIEGSQQLENRELYPVFNKIYNELSYHDNATQLAIDGLLSQAFAILLRNAHEKGKTPTWVSKAKEVLHDAATEKISLEQLSLETGVHPVHLSKEFPKYFEVSFGEYVRNLKVDRATTLLLDNSLTITDIAYQCGFADQSHFIRCFKERNGITPLKFRQNRLKR